MAFNVIVLLKDQELTETEKIDSVLSFHNEADYDEWREKSHDTLAVLIRNGDVITLENVRLKLFLPMVPVEA